MTGRNYRLNKLFEADYTFVDPDGEIYESPFPVLVFTVDQRLLGVGEVVGRLISPLMRSVMPVISINDADEPETELLFLGPECIWTCPVPEDIAHTLDAYPEKRHSAMEYAAILVARESSRFN